MKLRLFTDYLIEPGLSLRIDLRRAFDTQPDQTIRASRFEFGEPTAIVETPFMTARY